MAIARPRDPFKFIVFLDLALFCLAVGINVTTSDAQEVPGFLSIDCGSDIIAYKDPGTELTWEKDDNYTHTGMNGNVFSPFPVTFNSTVDNYQALQSFRYFPEPKNKYCYDLPMTANNVSFLIRAMFLHGDSSKLVLPIEFDVYITNTFWFSIQYDIRDPSDVIWTPKVKEGIFYPLGRLTYFCLVKKTGVPFISSLEVRMLDPEGIMYNYSDHQLLYLSNLIRWNPGVSAGAPTVRYPDDKYDRLWRPPNFENDNMNDLNPIPRISAPRPSNSNTSALVNNVPAKVMQDAWRIVDGQTGQNGITFNVSEISQPTFVYVALYFQDFNASDSGGLEMSIQLNRNRLPSFNVTDTVTMQPNPPSISILQESQLLIQTFYSQADDGLLLNAVEVYESKIFNPATTDADDVHTINICKESLNLIDWDGDPCLPMAYDGLNCNFDSYSFIYRVKSMTLSKVNGSANLVYPIESTENSRPLPSLEDLSLTNSDINDDTFQFLVNRFVPYKLEKLDLSYNVIKTIPIGRYWTPIYLISLTLSNNAITGEVPSFVDMKLSTTLEELNMSHNAMNSLPNNWGNTSMGLTKLVVLDLSHNNLSGKITLLDALVQNNAITLQTLDLSYNALTSIPTKWGDPSMGLRNLVSLDLSHNNLNGDISSFDELLQKNSLSLQKLDLSFNGMTSLPTMWTTTTLGKLDNLLILDFSHNNLSGEIFSLDKLFQQRSKLQNINFDENHIYGTLNLSAWYETLEQVIKGSNISTIDQVFSFVNNDISDIIPSVNFHQGNIDTLLERFPSFNKGVLLGGNPYCKSVKSQAQRYLCRFTINDTYKEDVEEKKKSIVPSILGGVSAFLFCCILLATIWIWRLWKRIHALQQIQQALALQRVQPQFFSYNDLKLATQNFHEENKLGEGGFGVVYKGVLDDGTTLAVKIPKPSKKSKDVLLLNDFLNEVVLITGIKHKNLVQLKGCCIKDKQRILIYEHVENGNLAEILWEKKGFQIVDWQQRVNICVDIARGLSYLHEELQPSIIHRDIKAVNILLDTNFNAKIADFGLARHFLDEQDQTQYTEHIAGTTGYVAPEHATQGQLTEKSDVYSFGILVLEIISGRKCIDHTMSPEKEYLLTWVQDLNKKRMLFELLESKLRKHCQEDEVIQVIKIALACVQWDPRSRPMMSQVVTMFLGNIDATIFLDKKNHHRYQNIILPNDNDTNRSTLLNCEPLLEETEESPLLHNKPKVLNSNSTSNIARVELSEVELSTLTIGESITVTIPR